MFKAKEIFKIKSIPVDPASVAAPTSADEFQSRGMMQYARQCYSEAESDLLKAISLNPDHLEACYCLGLVYKAVNRKEVAREAFQRVLEIIGHKAETRSAKNDMLRRLALAHINMLTQGDWNLETLIWKRVA